MPGVHSLPVGELLGVSYTMPYVPSLPGGALLGVSYTMPGVPSLPGGELLGVFYTLPGVPSLPEGELLGVTTAPGTGFATGESPARALLHCPAPIYCTAYALHCIKVL